MPSEGGREKREGGREEREEREAREARNKKDERRVDVVDVGPVRPRREEGEKEADEDETQGGEEGRRTCEGEIEEGKEKAAAVVTIWTLDAGEKERESGERE
jgi:hypothetical protein